MPNSSLTVSSAARRSGSRIVRNITLLLLLIGISCWLAGKRALNEVVELWTISDPVELVDAVAVFGGGLETRPFAAAEYYRKGLAKKILVANTRLSKSEMMGILPPHSILNQTVLIAQGVSETDIEPFGMDLSSTYEEAVALREWALRAHVRSLIVPTERFSSRRVHWVLDRVFAGTGIEIRVPALDDPDYAVWWKNKEAVLVFQNEVLKYFWYRINF
jgi:uncharacterized SAM-binding protein YcdF (DUF218 family)